MSVSIEGPGCVEAYRKGRVPVVCPEGLGLQVAAGCLLVQAAAQGRPGPPRPGARAAYGQTALLASGYRFSRGRSGSASSPSRKRACKNLDL